MIRASNPDDALIASAEHHFVKLENEHVRVLETRIAPGETTRMHTHEWPAATYVLSWSACIRRDENDVIIFDSRDLETSPEEGNTMWAEPFPLHTLENVGDRDIHVISVEIKPSR